METFEQYLEAERACTRGRHSWVNGEATVIPPRNLFQAAAVLALHDFLSPGALATGCRRFTGNRILRTPDAAHYPDLMLVRGRAATHHYEVDAAILAEVRTRGAAILDRREKVPHFATVPSLELYLLVDQRHRIQVGTNDGDRWAWETAKAGDVIGTSCGPLDVTALYAAIDPFVVPEPYVLEPSGSVLPG